MQKKFYNPVLLFGFAFLVVIFLKSCTEKSDSNDAQIVEAATENELPEPDLYLGIDTGNLAIVSGTVNRNETLGVILNRNGVSHRTIAYLSDAASDIFDVRRIRVGQPYSILQTKTDTPSVSHFIYEINATDYVVFQIDDSIAVFRGEKEVELKKRIATGVIESSLYLTLSRNDLPIILANRLSEVYAWAIDFHRIQRGDKFKVAYLERMVDGKRIGIERIEYAVFYNNNRPFYAFYYEQNGVGDYFDQDGNSLRRAFLRAPLEYTRISSGYTQRRFHPIHRVYRPHLGVDYAAPEGTPIRSVGDGVIVRAGFTSGNGNYIKIRHNSVYSTQYLHMSRFAQGMRQGEHVKQGQVIGYVGMTGLATGPHLCFRFWKNGEQVNPLTVEVPPAEPIEEQYLTDYLSKMKEQKASLDNLLFEDQRLTAGL